LKREPFVSQITSAKTAPVIGSEAEAAFALGEVRDLMNELGDVIEQETALVRAGRLAAAAAIAERKRELAGTFMAYASRMRASFRAPRVPGLVEELRTQHEQFRARLQVNLTVLTTARAVVEGIVRGVSSQLARRSSPQTYGASGRPVAPARRPTTPIALSRKL
jgi:hypothetical protein